jgi:hypothetical protein
VLASSVIEVRAILLSPSCAERSSPEAPTLWPCARCRIGGQRVALAGTFPTALPRTNHAPFNAVSSPGLLCPFLSKSSGPSRPTSVSRTSPYGTSPCTWPSHAPRRVVTPAITIAVPSPCVSRRVGDPQVTPDLRSICRHPVRRFSFPTSWS